MASEWKSSGRGYDNFGRIKVSSFSILGLRFGTWVKIDEEEYGGRRLDCAAVAF